MAKDRLWQTIFPKMPIILGGVVPFEMPTSMVVKLVILVRKIGFAGAADSSPESGWKSTAASRPRNQGLTSVGDSPLPKGHRHGEKKGKILRQSTSVSSGIEKLTNCWRREKKKKPNYRFREQPGKEPGATT